MTASNSNRLPVNRELLARLFSKIQVSTQAVMASKESRRKRRQRQKELKQVAHS